MNQDERQRAALAACRLLLASRLSDNAAQRNKMVADAVKLAEVAADVTVAALREARAAAGGGE